jgi:hypothetical protein
MLLWNAISPLVYQYEPVTNAWGFSSSTGAPDPRTQGSAVWTGTRFIVWGGQAWVNSTPVNSGGQWRPLSLYVKN